ncbi:MAG: UTRA domain-containing protein [Caulobacteraceae bacterium]|nr:UTRA domain-containing protein [Caulobacteraceae bacterium]
MAAALALLALPAAGRAQDRQAELQGLQRDLLAGGSATVILGRWCADHRLADPPRIVALRDPGASVQAPPEVRRHLQARPGEAIAYRRVRLACGERVLSEADNWYLPDRLTPAMNQTLETTDTPFGLAVKALDFHRVTVEARRLWLGRSDAPPPIRLLRIEAVLVAGAGAPFAFVRETYRGDLFAGPHVAVNGK